MRRLLTSTVLATAAASAAVVLAASSAYAATFEVSGANADGSAIGDAGTTTLTTPNAQLTCATSQAIASNLFNGPSDGMPIANIIDLTFDDCNLGGFINFDVTTSGFPWDLNVSSVSSGVAQGQIAGTIRAHISGTNLACEADVIGTTVPATYGDGVLSVLGTGQDLTIANVSGCAGQISDGQSASFAGDYLIDPPVVITQTG